MERCSILVGLIMFFRESLQPNFVLKDFSAFGQACSILCRKLNAKIHRALAHGVEFQKGGRADRQRRWQVAHCGVWIRANLSDFLLDHARRSTLTRPVVRNGHLAGCVGRS